MSASAFSELSSPERFRLGATLRRHKVHVAERVTDEFFARHPEWLVRFGERGRQFGIEDAGFHIDFLAAAIENESVAAFEDYSRWLARLLGSRGISAQHAAENFEQIAIATRTYLQEAESKVVDRLVQHGCAALLEEKTTAVVSAGSSLLARERTVFLQALLAGQRTAAANVAREAFREGHTLNDIYVELFQESLYAIGRKWETNQITVAQEHMATAIVQWSVAQLYPLIEPAPAVRGNALITGVQGEYHQVGSNLVADTLEACGWNVRFLGTNMPPAGIIQAMEEHQTTLLGVSATMPFSLPKVRELIGMVRKCFSRESLRIVLGGAAFRNLPGIVSELTSEGIGLDVRSALALCNGLG